MVIPTRCGVRDPRSDRARARAKENENIRFLSESRRICREVESPLLLPLGSGEIILKSVGGGWKSRRARGRENGTRRALRTWRSSANSVIRDRGECSSCVLRFVSCITVLIYGGRLSTLHIQRESGGARFQRRPGTRDTIFISLVVVSYVRLCEGSRGPLRAARFVSLDGDETALVNAVRHVCAPRTASGPFLSLSLLFPLASFNTPPLFEAARKLQRCKKKREKRRGRRGEKRSRSMMMPARKPSFTGVE